MTAPRPDAAAECQVTITKEPYPLKVDGELTFHDRRGDAQEAKDGINAALRTLLAPPTYAGERRVGQVDDAFTVEGKIDGKKAEVKLELANANPVLVPGGKDGDVEVRIKKAKGPQPRRGSTPARYRFGPSRPA